MPKLPVPAGRDIVRGLERLRFLQISQRDSHIKLGRGSKTIIVPNHREVRKRTSAGLLERGGVSIVDLMRALSR